MKSFTQQIPPPYRQPTQPACINAGRSATGPTGDGELQRVVAPNPGMSRTGAGTKPPALPEQSPI